ncbi:MAG: hypothetical protein AAFY59_10560, partial [Pseudomonadota bacterium]
NFKRRYARPRPSQLHPALMPPIDPPKHAAFPSGHSTQAHLTAHILKHLMPDMVRHHYGAWDAGSQSRPEIERDPLFDMAERIARNREVMGLHYVSDSVAGEKLAKALYDTMVGWDVLSGIWAEAAKEW